MIADALPCTPTNSRREWLDSIVRGDLVLVRNVRLHFRAKVDVAHKTMLVIGSMRFRRKDGSLIRPHGSQLSCRSYAGFRLVQSKDEIV